MSLQTEERGPAPPLLPTATPSAIRWVCTNNPFYVISAGLFLAGLWVSFGDTSQIENTWLLIGGLGGYTLLLAATAYLLVRFVNLWDDARTVLLLVVLMFLATSVTFDALLVADAREGAPGRGFACYLVGLLFAVAVSEGLLRGIGLALPALFRVPYYLILSLFFLYPLALTQVGNLHEQRSEPVMWGLFGFSAAAGLVFLTLLPAIRRGADYVRENGSPWRWPLYPWTLFGMLALAVPARALLLCLSMQPIGMGDFDQTIFGCYFVVPFGLALAVLLLEMGLTARRQGLIWAALAVPIVLLVLMQFDQRSHALYREFLQTFTNRLGGTPAYLTLLAAAGLYGYAAMRRVPFALEALTGTLVVVALFGSTGSKDAGFAPSQHGPLLLAAALQLGMGIWQRLSWRCLLGSLAAIVPIVFAADSATGPLRVLAASQLALVSMLVIGAFFDDELARSLRVWGAVLAVICSMIALFVPIPARAGVPAWMIAVYPLAVAAVLAGYAAVLRDYRIAGAGAMIFAGWIAVSGWGGYQYCRQRVVGLDYIVSSMAAFVLAVLVSLGKSGMLSRSLARWRAKAKYDTD